LVIRRAVELYAAQTDADERLSEDEVLRIGKELGLPASIVRQAIYEAPAPAAESIVDRWFGAAAVSVSRAVQLPEGDVASRLEEYLATREYLVLRRRQHSLTIFEPAEDTISKMARALSRPSRHWYLARSRQVMLAVRPLEEGRTHVRIDMDLGNRRRESMVEGLVGGGIWGLALGGIAAAGAGFGLADFLGQTAESAPRAVDSSAPASTRHASCSMASSTASSAASASRPRPLPGGAASARPRPRPAGAERVAGHPIRPDRHASLCRLKPLPPPRIF